MPVPGGREARPPAFGLDTGTRTSYLGAKTQALLWNHTCLSARREACLAPDKWRTSVYLCSKVANSEDVGCREECDDLSFPRAAPRVQPLLLGPVLLLDVQTKVNSCLVPDLQGNREELRAFSPDRSLAGVGGGGPRKLGRDLGES